jgi:hypothetical protein
MMILSNIILHILGTPELIFNQQGFGTLLILRQLPASKSTPALSGHLPRECTPTISGLKCIEV